MGRTIAADLSSGIFSRQPERRALQFQDFSSDQNQGEARYMDGTDQAGSWNLSGERTRKEARYMSGTDQAGSWNLSGERTRKEARYMSGTNQVEARNLSGERTRREARYMSGTNQAEARNLSGKQNRSGAYPVGRADHMKYRGSSGNLNSMLKVDFRRMFTMPLFYIMFIISLAMPVLILVMTTMMDGTTTVDPTTGVVTTMEAFKNTWQIIGTASGDASAMGMDLTTMCNINLSYFMAGILICLFVSEDFRSGYAKNLFTVRPVKTDYVISKTVIGFVCGALLLIAFFIGAVFGGAVSGLPFDLGTASVAGLVMCMLAKIFMMGVFIAIFVVMSVIGKQKAWMSILLSLFGGMLLFMMVPMMTPLDSGPLNVVMCLAGSVLFAVGLGAVSNMVLRRTSLV